MEAKIKAIVEDAVKFADESPFPTPDELYKDVYKTSTARNNKYKVYNRPVT